LNSILGSPSSLSLCRRKVVYQLSSTARALLTPKHLVFDETRNSSIVLEGRATALRSFLGAYSARPNSWLISELLRVVSIAKVLTRTRDIGLGRLATLSLLFRLFTICKAVSPKLLNLIFRSHLARSILNTMACRRLGFVIETLSDRAVTKVRIISCKRLYSARIAVLLSSIEELGCLAWVVDDIVIYVVVVDDVGDIPSRYLLQITSFTLVVLGVAAGAIFCYFSLVVSSVLDRVVLPALVFSFIDKVVRLLRRLLFTH
jgi:hypothetical protein